MKRLLPVALLLVGVAACGGGGHHGSAPGLAGVVYDDTGAPARGQPVALDPPTGPLATVGVDGRFFLSPISPGTHLLRIGDSVKTPTVYTTVVTQDGASFLPRPIFLPLLESGILASVPTTTSFALNVSGPNLDGVVLTVSTSSTVLYPTNAPRAVTITGVSPSRLPVPLPNLRAAKVAYCIEPRGVRFAPQAMLTLPQLEDSPAGWDLWKLDDTAQWTVVAPLTAVGSSSLTAPIDEGSLYAAVPRTPPATITITGRVTAGARAVAGYRVECWNQVSDRTGTDGRFTIADVPQSFGGFLLHAYPDKPGAEFAPEVATSVALLNGNDVGDVVVNAQAPITVRPKVLSTQPVDKSTDVPLQTQVSVQFSDAVDPLGLGLTLKGLQGPVTGQVFLANAFTAIFVPASNLDPADTYSIVVDPSTTDLAGNAVDDTQLVFRFTTQNVPPPPPPTDQKIFGLTPIVGTSSTVVRMVGRNFPGGSAVRVGNSNALVQLETATEIRFLPPALEPASDAAVSVINSANTTVVSLGPLVFDLRSDVSSLSTGTLVRSSAPSSFFVTGSSTANGSVTVDGLTIASIDSLESFGGILGVTGRQVPVAPGLPGVFTGPVVVRGANGKPGLSYRFLQVADR